MCNQAPSQHTKHTHTNKHTHTYTPSFCLPTCSCAHMEEGMVLTSNPSPFCACWAMAGSSWLTVAACVTIIIFNHISCIFYIKVMSDWLMLKKRYGISNRIRNLTGKQVQASSCTEASESCHQTSTHKDQFSENTDICPNLNSADLICMALEVNIDIFLRASLWSF